MQRNFRKKDVLRRLGELAFARANDPVKIAFYDNQRPEFDLSELDLTVLTEFRRSANGSIEMKFVNRLDALKLLLEVLERDETGEAEEFFTALDSAGEGL